MNYLIRRNNKNIVNFSTKSLRQFSVIAPSDDEEFNEIVKSGKAVHYFTASWCPPCRMIAPIFTQLAEEYSDIKFIKIDVDEVPEAASKNKIQSVPTFMFLSDGTKIAEFAGASEDMLRANLDKLKIE